MTHILEVKVDTITTKGQQSVQFRTIELHLEHTLLVGFQKSDQ